MGATNNVSDFVDVQPMPNPSILRKNWASSSNISHLDDDINNKKIINDHLQTGNKKDFSTSDFQKSKSNNKNDQIEINKNLSQTERGWRRMDRLMPPLETYLKVLQD